MSANRNMASRQLRKAERMIDDYQFSCDLENGGLTDEDVSAIHFYRLSFADSINAHRLANAAERIAAALDRMAAR